MSFSLLRKMSGERGAKPRSSTSLTKGRSPSIGGDQKDKGKRDTTSPTVAPHQRVTSNVTVRPTQSSAGKANQKYRPFMGHKPTERPIQRCSNTGSLDNPQLSTSRTVSLSNLGQPIRHVHADVLDKSKKPSIYPKARSPTIRTQQEVTLSTSSEPVTVSLPTPNKGKAPTTEPLETTEVSQLDISSTIQDTGFIQDVNIVTVRRLIFSF